MTDLGEIKRDRPCNRRWLLRHAALSLPFILVGSMPARAVERVGSVEDSNGEAFAELDAVRRTLGRAAPGFVGAGGATAHAARRVGPAGTFSATKSRPASRPGWECGSAAIRRSGLANKRG